MGCLVAALMLWVLFCALMALDTVLPSPEPRMRVYSELGFLWWFRLYLTLGLIHTVRQCDMCDGSGVHDAERYVLCGYCDGTGIQMPHPWFGGGR